MSKVKIEVKNAKILQSVLVVSPPTVGEFTSTSIMNVLFPGRLCSLCLALQVSCIRFILTLI